MMNSLTPSFVKMDTDPSNDAAANSPPSFGCAAMRCTLKSCAWIDGSVLPVFTSKKYSFPSNPLAHTMLPSHEIAHEYSAPLPP